jgi:ABC-type hemin transport system substrate-binding protein
MEGRMTGGNGHAAVLSFTEAPRRAVSLVPSMTESLFELGAGPAVVGVTEYCQPPASEADRLVRVGGTRSVDTEAVLRLNPDLVLANQEENTRQVVEDLEAAGLPVWVTFPRSVEEAVQVLWAVVRVFRLTQAQSKVRTLETAVAWTARAALAEPAVPTFVPIWQGSSGERSWLMTIGRDTYVHDVLAVCGAANVFADRERRYPLEADIGDAPEEPQSGRDTRYPRVSLQEVIERAPQLILLPSEPYAFGNEDALRLAQELRGTPAADEGRILPIDGSLLTWHGTRLGRALVELPALIRPAEPA